MKLKYITFLFLIVSFDLYSSKFLIVSEFAPGKSLGSYLKSIIHKREKLDLKEALKKIDWSNNNFFNNYDCSHNNLNDKKPLNSTKFNNQINAIKHHKTPVKKFLMQQDTLKSLFNLFKYNHERFPLLRTLNDKDFLNAEKSSIEGKLCYGSNAVKIIHQFMNDSGTEFYTLALFSNDREKQDILLLKIIDTKKDKKERGGQNEIKNLQTVCHLLPQIKYFPELTFVKPLAFYKIVEDFEPIIENFSSENLPSEDSANEISSDELSDIYYEFGSQMAKFHLINMDKETMETDFAKEDFNRKNIINYFKTQIHGDLHDENVIYSKEKKLFYIIDNETMSHCIHEKKSVFIDIGRFSLMMLSKMGLVKDPHHKMFFRILLSRFISGYVENYEQKYQPFLRYIMGKKIAENNDGIKLINFHPFNLTHSAYFNHEKLTHILTQCDIFMDDSDFKKSFFDTNLAESPEEVMENHKLESHENHYQDSLLDIANENENKGTSYQTAL